MVGLRWQSDSGPLVPVFSVLIALCVGCDLQNMTRQPGEPGAATRSPAAPSSPWLARLNGYREPEGLAPVAENPALSEGDLAHARYLVKNNMIGIGYGAEMHNEDPSNPWYSREGLEAARASNVIPPGNSPFDGPEAIDVWMSAPFHALPILDPDLREAGFAEYCQGPECAAALRVGRDESWFRNPAHTRLEDPERQQHDNPYVYELTVRTKALASPVEVPPDGSTITHGSFDGGEWPNPLASCPGYQPPTGPAVILELGTEVNPEISSHSFSSDGVPLEHCVFNADSYTNSDETQQQAARSDLKLMGAIVMMPRAPLVVGKTYEVVVTAGDQTHQWSFKFAPKTPPASN